MTHSPKPEDLECAACGKPAPNKRYDTGGKHGHAPFCTSCGKLSCEAFDKAVDARRALSAQPSKVEMYGTQPSVLPETLPEGTRWRYPSGPTGRQSVSEVQLRKGAQYWAVWERLGQSESWVPPEYIDWATVPKPATPPTAPAAESNPEKRPDPYAKHNAERSETWHQNKTVERDLAYRRRVQVDSLLRDMGRPMVRSDKMGRDLVPWVGWVSTFNARDSK